MSEEQKSLLDQDTPAPWEEDDAKEQSNVPPIEELRDGIIPNRDLAKVEPVDAPVTATPSRQLSDLRDRAMACDVETMRAGLVELIDRRTAFREFLLSVMIEGVHYGYPPGTEPKYDDQGRQVAWNKKSKSFEPIDPKQWVKTPCLYEAGADLIADLMGVEFQVYADADLWAQMGSKEHYFAFRCDLVSIDTGKKLGEGFGASRTADHDGNVNSAVQLGRKRAKVRAIRDTYKVADLFSQDLDAVDHGPTPRDAPDHDETQPKTPTRSERVTVEMIEELIREWKLGRHDYDCTAGHWANYVASVCSRRFDVKKLAEWTYEDYKCVATCVGIPIEKESKL